MTAKSKGRAVSDGAEGRQRSLANLKPFKPGESGNPKGRAKGSRNKLGEAFLKALHEDFEEHGKTAIEQARAESPLGYVKVCASILPKDLNVNVNPLEELTDAELIERIGQLESAVNAALGRTVDPESGAEASTRH